MSTKWQINGATVTGVPDPDDCIWDDDEPAERTHSGAAQSMAFVGVTLDWAPLTRAEWDALNDALDALGGKISTSIRVIGRNYDDPDSWATIAVFDGRGMWPQRPKGRLVHHLITGPGRQGGPTLYIAHVAPARV